jgi:hypothetical protein
MGIVGQCFYTFVKLSMAIDYSRYSQSLLVLVMMDVVVYGLSLVHYFYAYLSYDLLTSWM